MIDIASELARLHVLEGAEFVLQLKVIASHEGFHPLEDNPDIYTMGGAQREDYANQLAAARRAVELGYRVYILPNPPGIRTADFIFVRKGIYKMYDLKTIYGQASVISRLMDSVGQSNHILLNMRTNYNSGRLALEIRKYFENNPNAFEVLIFIGKKVLSVKRQYALQKNFFTSFRKSYR